MENIICTIDTVCGDQICLCQQTKNHQKSKKSIWNGFGQLVGMIGESIHELLRSNDAPPPAFSNGGTRVLIRPDRIDLI